MTVEAMIWTTMYDRCTVNDHGVFSPLERRGKQGKLELDMLHEQVAVHRGEFAELEASTTRKISELQLLLAAESNKVCLP